MNRFWDWLESLDELGPDDGFGHFCCAMTWGLIRFAVPALLLLWAIEELSLWERITR